MYHSEIGIHAALNARRADGRRFLAPVGATVYFLGLTSLLTDVSSEMVASVLPVYFLSVLRLSPLEFGLIDGVYNGATAVIRLIAGYLSDLTRKHKAIAFIGYLLSALSRFGLFFAGVAGWMSAAAVILMDRIGKGIRTSPRDAMIAAEAAPQTMGAAFGVHRAMDAVGAIIGPLLAATILLLLPKRFDLIFFASICFAVLGLLVLGLLVKPRRAAAGADSSEPMTLAATFSAFKSPGFDLLSFAACVLSVFTLSDAMIYVGLQRQLQFRASLIPLMFVGTATVFMCLAIPFGRLADRYGHLRIFLLGYFLLALTYGLFSLLPAWTFSPLVYIVLLGAYYAATDGVIVALAAAQLKPELRATGIAWIATIMSLGRMASSVLFGWVWENAGHVPAVALFFIGLLISLACTAALAAKLGEKACEA